MVERSEADSVCEEVLKWSDKDFVWSTMTRCLHSLHSKTSTLTEDFIIHYIDK